MSNYKITGVKSGSNNNIIADALFNNRREESLFLVIDK